MTPREIAESLGLELDLDRFESKGEVFFLRQVKRKIRFLCFAMQRKNEENSEDKTEVPKKFIEYFESHPKFEGWDLFGETWDVLEDNPVELYFRDFSIHEEWDATLRRVVPELKRIDRAARREQ